MDPFLDQVDRGAVFDVKHRAKIFPAKLRGFLKIIKKPPFPGPIASRSFSSAAAFF